MRGDWDILHIGRQNLEFVEGTSQIAEVLATWGDNNQNNSLAFCIFLLVNIIILFMLFSFYGKNVKLIMRSKNIGTVTLYPNIATNFQQYIAEKEWRHLYESRCRCKSCIKSLVSQVSTKQYHNQYKLV